MKKSLSALSLSFLLVSGTPAFAGDVYSPTHTPASAAAEKTTAGRNDAATADYNEYGGASEVRVESGWHNTKPRDLFAHH
jgi:hypothetical protein